MIAVAVGDDYRAQGRIMSDKAAYERQQGRVWSLSIEWQAKIQKDSFA